MNKKNRGVKSRSRALAVAGAALVALIASPLAGSAALSNGGFSIKSFDDATPSIYSIYGISNGQGAEPENPEPTPEPTPDPTPEPTPDPTPDPPAGEPDEVVFTVNTTLQGCTNPGFNITPTTARSAKVNWGDGTPEANATSNMSHSYATPGTYKVKVKGSIKTFSGTTTMVGAADCIQSADYFGPDTGITQISSMFVGANNLRYAASPPSTVIYAASVFRDTPGFNGDVSSWKLPNATTMAGMFYGASSFTGDLSKWDTSSVTNMSGMFQNATKFNSNISGWDVRKVTNFSRMFQNADSFNQDLTRWNLDSATNLSSMFAENDGFTTAPAWDTKNVTNFSGMFYGSTAFNGNISGWNTANATDMSTMFHYASAFDQNISGWNVDKATSFANFAPLMDKSKIPAKFR